MTNSLQHRAEILQDRFGLKLAAHLSSVTAELPYDISERLRAGRVQALSHRKITRLQAAPAASAQGGVLTLGSGDEGLGLWSRFASLIPLVALIVGLVSINMLQNDSRAQEVAEIDAALLTDDLPPTAYADPGFIQFLKSGPDSTR